MLKTILKLKVKAQSATSGAPLGPALGQHGIPTMDFCKKFNDQSINYTKGIKLNVLVYIQFDRTYRIEIKGPSLSSFFKKILSRDFGSKRPGFYSSINLSLPCPILFELYQLKYSFSDLRSYNRIKCYKGSAESNGYFIC